MWTACRWTVESVSSMTATIFTLAIFAESGITVLITVFFSWLCCYGVMSLVWKRLYIFMKKELHCITLGLIQIDNLNLIACLMCYFLSSENWRKHEWKNKDDTCTCRPEVNIFLTVYIHFTDRLTLTATNCTFKNRCLNSGHAGLVWVIENLESHGIL